MRAIGFRDRVRISLGARVRRRATFEDISYFKICHFVSLSWSSRNGRPCIIKGPVARIKLSVRRVQQLEELGVFVCHPAGGFEKEKNVRRYKLFKDGDHSQVSVELQVAAELVDELVKTLENEPSLPKRRKIAQERGHTLGRLVDAFDLSTAMAADYQRPLLGHYANMVLGRTLGRFFYLCQWQLADD